jgi:hypothetical protein
MSKLTEQDPDKSMASKMMALAEKVKARDYKLAHELQELARELMGK